MKSLTISATGLKIGIYSGTGAESGTILALFRAVASMGYTPMALTSVDITAGRLTKSNFDVLILPPGEDGKTSGTFSSSSAIGKADLVRYTYGKGRVALTTTHPETLAGSNNDWLFWDNYDYRTGSQVTNTTQSWAVMAAIFNNWLTLP